MPPWGVAGGGALSDQQIDDLVAYLDSIKLTPKQAQAQAADLGTDGAKLFDAFCARCHTKSWSYFEPDIDPPLVQGGGAFGPNLRAGSATRQFPDPSAQIEWVSRTADFGKPYGVRGVSHGIMPHFENMLTPEQIQAVVDYERGL
jgi:mono/diheme cytochrome c family protein